MIRKYRELPVSLPVAAALAYRELVAPGRRVSPYDAEHLSEMLSLVAHALARVAPLHVVDEGGAAPRALSERELEGAAIRRGATVVELADGRALRRVTLRRGDLRDAITILKTIGFACQGQASCAETRR